jgi:hypothetical protein
MVGAEAMMMMTSMMLVLKLMVLPLRRAKMTFLSRSE